MVAYLEVSALMDEEFIHLNLIFDIYRGDINAYRPATTQTSKSKPPVIEQPDPDTPASRPQGELFYVLCQSLHGWGPLISWDRWNPIGV